MDERSEEDVDKFYNTVGWKTDAGITEDARRWEDLRPCSQDYVRKCRLRVLRHIPEKGENILDMASGPIQFEEYLEYSRNFSKRYCVDLSSEALEEAKKKIGDHGVFLCGNFLEMDIEENFFDCVLSLHTIFHINKDDQEHAVRKLIRVAKKGSPVIIVYYSPRSFFNLLKYPLSKLVVAIRGSKTSVGIYHYAYPLSWWKQFSDEAHVRIYPWRSFEGRIQKALFPDNKLGRKMFDVLYKMEERFPSFFAAFVQIPMIVLTKK